MNRRAGIAGLQRATHSREAFSVLSKGLGQQQADALQDQANAFRVGLDRFAREHRQDILANPVLRTAFVQMCASVGVDPLQGAGPARRLGLFGLGLAEWHAELGTQICDVCIGTRARNGGLVSLPELVRTLERIRGPGTRITEDDVARAIVSLAPLGAGYEIVTAGGVRMVCSVPRELDVDQTTLLGVAADRAGRLDEDTVVAATGWTVERARAALDNMLMREGACWIDDGPEGTSYWVPSVMHWDDD
ncbi:winged helix DNA-binding domain-containing protein [Auriculariales sp. MPI-PUGE-AT-0066]|nr:winged helix DNA-binding domain-containing protein [Auriculariales sp. MPI-PUGE-AT-0066]